MSPSTGARRHVVFVNRYYAPDHSATSQMLGGVARGLSAAGLDVTVVASRQLYENAGAALPASEVIEGVAVVRVAGTAFGRRRLLGRAIDYLSFYAGAFLTLLRVVRPGWIVVAKTDPPLVAIVCAPAAWLRRAALVNWYQDVFPEVASALGMERLPVVVIRALAAARDRTCRTAAGNVVLGNRMREFFVRRGIPPGRLTIIPNWADGERVRPQEPGTVALKASLGLADKFVVAYCGNLGLAHDHETLLEAGVRLGALEDVRFLMVGGGAGFDALREGVRRRELANFVFLPYQPEAALGETLAAGDVHLLCLRPELEGLVVPSKLYGILAAGRPSIFWGDPHGEVARVLSESRAGLTVGARDGGALADAIRRLRDQPGRRLEMGRAARGAYESGYSREMAVERWQALLTAIPGG